MNATVDHKRRATMPVEFSPGDVVSMETTAPGVVLVRLMKPVAKARIKAGPGRGLLAAFKACPAPLAKVTRHRLPYR